MGLNSTQVLHPFPISCKTKKPNEFARVPAYTPYKCVCMCVHMDWPQNVTGILSIFVNGSLGLGQGAIGPKLGAWQPLREPKRIFLVLLLSLTILLFPVSFERLK